MKRSAKNGLEKEVKIYPNVPYEKMWEIYEMSDYYLNMNKGEIFGMAIMEAVIIKPLWLLSAPWDLL
mgnify:CR=1 FL=1